MILRSPADCACAVHNVEAVLLRDLLVARRYQACIIVLERLVEPFRHQPIDVIAAILDRSLASAFPLEMSINLVQAARSVRSISGDPSGRLVEKLGASPSPRLLWPRGRLIFRSIPTTPWPWRALRGF